MARVIFMGTPEFAVPTLEALEAEHDVVGVVTQPDRAAGRGRRLVSSPVKKTAAAEGLPLLQPRSLLAEEAVRYLVGLRPDVIVVAAFGQLLPPAVLGVPQYGCLNVHASLLPRHRGAAPIAAAILAGDTSTGITIMKMDEGLDTGPVLAQSAIPVAPEDTTGSLSCKQAALGAELLIKTLPDWLEGKIAPLAQDESQATTCEQLRKADGEMHWMRPAELLGRQVRAFSPWPGSFTTWRGRRLKVLRAQPWNDWEGQRTPGLVVGLPNGLGVVTGLGYLELKEVQLAGKKPMDAELFLRGQQQIVGEILGREADS